MNQVSPRLQRLLAITILLAVLALVYTLVISPIVSAYDRYNAEIADTRDLLQRYQKIAGYREDLRQQSEDMGRRPEVLEAYLPGDSGSMAAADLQQQIQSIARQARARVASVQSLSATGSESDRRIALRISMSADIEALQEVFYRIEHLRPFLVIDNVDISADRRRGRRLRGTTTGSTDETLTVRFEVSGYMRTAP